MYVPVTYEHRSKRDYRGILFKYLTGYKRCRHGRTCETVFAGHNAIDMGLCFVKAFEGIALCSEETFEDI